MVWTVWDEVEEKDWEEWEKTYEAMKTYEEARELAKFWIHNLDQLAIFHPRVAKKVRENVKRWAGVENEKEAFIRLAEELLKRRQKRPQLQSAKIALTYHRYLYYYHGSAVKLYYDGAVVYRDHNCFAGLSFIIYDGEEVA